MRPSVLLYRLAIQQFVLPNRLICETRFCIHAFGRYPVRISANAPTPTEVCRGMPSVAVPPLSMSCPFHHPSTKLYWICCGNEPYVITTLWLKPYNVHILIYFCYNRVSVLASSIVSLTLNFFRSEVECTTSNPLKSGGPGIALRMAPSVWHVWLYQELTLPAA